MSLHACPQCGGLHRGATPRTAAQKRDEIAALVGLLIRRGAFTEQQGFALLGAIVNHDPEPVRAAFGIGP